MFKFLVPLITIAAVFYIGGLGSWPLNDYDEAGYAIIVREMAQNNDYFNLTYLKRPFFEKPPFLLWITALSVKIFGLSEFALRLPTALFGVFAVILIFLILWEITRNPKISFLGGLILVLLPFFLAATRQIRLDTPVTAMILASIFFYLKGIKNPKFFIGIGIATGIGVMIKSVIGLLSFPLLIIWSIFYKNWDWLKSKFFWLGLILFLIIAAPWHIQQTAKFGGEFWNEYLGRHVLDRAAKNIISDNSGKISILNTLWTHSRPWSILFLAAIPAGIFIWKKKGLDSYILASIFSTIFIFLFFLAPKTVLISYFTPTYPFIAIFLSGIGITLFKNFNNKIIKTIFLIFAAFILIISLFLISKEAFGRPKLYALDISKDEREIGLYLAGLTNKELIYVFEWSHHIALKYYSENEVNPIELESGTVETEPPFWLILPTKLLEDNPNLKKMPIPYSGEYLTLVHFEP